MAADELGKLSRERLREMLAAGEEVLACQQALARTGSNPVAEMLKGQGAFRQLDHYPKGDIYDPASHAQYYYHAHRPGPEHGHFHTFLRREGMDASFRAARRFAGAPTPSARQDLTHLIAIQMDGAGRPIGLFTTNRWVTDETWFPAREVMAALDRFRITHDHPSAWVNRWVAAMLRLFRPEICQLLIARDATVEGFARRHPGQSVLDDPRLDMTSHQSISIDRQIRRVRRLLPRAA